MEADAAWDHDVRDVCAATVAEEASPASRFMVSSVEPLVLAPLVASCMGGSLWQNLLNYKAHMHLSMSNDL